MALVNDQTVSLSTLTVEESRGSLLESAVACCFYLKQTNRSQSTEVSGLLRESTEALLNDDKEDKSYRVICGIRGGMNMSVNELEVKSLSKEVIWLVRGGGELSNDTEVLLISTDGATV